MARGRPVKCPYCGGTRTVGKGYRETVTLGKRRLRLCRSCGRKFTQGRPKTEFGDMPKVDGKVPGKENEETGVSTDETPTERHELSSAASY